VKLSPSRSPDHPRATLQPGVGHAARAHAAALWFVRGRAHNVAPRTPLTGRRWPVQSRAAAWWRRPSWPWRGPHPASSQAPSCWSARQSCVVTWAGRKVRAGKDEWGKVGPVPLSSLALTASGREGPAGPGRTARRVEGTGAWQHTSVRTRQLRWPEGMTSFLLAASACGCSKTKRCVRAPDNEVVGAGSGTDGACVWAAFGKAGQCRDMDYFTGRGGGPLRDCALPTSRRHITCRQVFRTRAGGPQAAALASSVCPLSVRAAPWCTPACNRTWSGWAARIGTQLGN
jgi:hypothetical protein